MEWNGDKVLADREALYGRRVQAAAIHLVNQVRINISVPSRTVSHRMGKGGKVVKVLGGRGSDRSNPGEFPHKDTGKLRQSITFSYKPIIARVGTTLKYGKFLELGTQKMRPRPFLRRTLREEQEPIRQIIEHGQAQQISVGGGA